MSIKQTPVIMVNYFVSFAAINARGAANLVNMSITLDYYIKSMDDVKSVERYLLNSYCKSLGREYNLGRVVLFSYQILTS